MLLGRIVAGASALTLAPNAPATAGPDVCVGDCDASGSVSVGDLLAMINIALGSAGSCTAGDADGNGYIDVTDIVAAVDRALRGCGGSVPTPTPDLFEAGACYESSNCFPSNAYPSRPFAATRGYCCQLFSTSNGVPFSWCPADMFDDGSAACTQCVAPCGGGPMPTPAQTPTPFQAGACYESYNCFPSEDYPFRPFLTNRAFCCHLRQGGGTFSWCPADMYDSSSLSCTQCTVPCQ